MRTSKIVACLAASLILLGNSVSGQTVTIRLLNAKSGKPMIGQNVTLSWCPDCRSQSIVTIGKDGIGKAPVSPKATTLTISEGPKKGKEPFRIAYLDCNERPILDVAVAQIVAKGFVPQNSCSRKTVEPVPGQIVFWGLPIPWWEPDFQ